MMKIKIDVLSVLILFIFLAAAVSAQNSGNVEVKKTFYPNGVLKTQGDYIAGKLNGQYLEYYPDGRLWKVWNFVNGKENGKSDWYFENGLLSIEWNYRNGLKEDTSKWYYETGELWSVQNYYRKNINFNFQHHFFGK